jgi:hypothetical protein
MGAAVAAQQTGMGAAGAAQQTGMGAAVAAQQTGMGPAGAAQQTGMGPAGAAQQTGMETAVEAHQTGMGAAVAAQQTGMGAAVAAQQTGMGAAVAAQQTGMGAAGAAQQTGMGAAVAAQQTGMGAAVAAQQTGMGAAVAAQQTGMGPAGAAQQTGMGPAGAAQQTPTWTEEVSEIGRAMQEGGQNCSEDVLKILQEAGLGDIVSAAGEVKTQVFQAVKEGICNTLPWLARAAEVVGPAVPFFAPVFSLLTKAYGAVCAMKEVNDQVQILRQSLENLANALFRALCSYAEAIDRTLLPALQKKIEDIAVSTLLTDINTFLARQTQRGFLMRFLLATSDAAKVEGMQEVKECMRVHVYLQ